MNSESVTISRETYDELMRCARTLNGEEYIYITSYGGEYHGVGLKDICHKYERLIDTKEEIIEKLEIELANAKMPWWKRKKDPFNG